MIVSLLPKSFNAAFGAKPYDVKCKQYFGQNYLAKSLHENAYELHSRFDSFKQRSGLPFRSHTEYSKNMNVQNSISRDADSGRVFDKRSIVMPSHGSDCHNISRRAASNHTSTGCSHESVVLFTGSAV